MYKILIPILAAAVLTCAAAPEAQAGLFSRKKKAGNTAVADTTAKKKKPQPTSYEKLFKDKPYYKVAKSSFITVHKQENKVFLEIPPKYLGREMLVGSTLTRTSDPSIADIGAKPTGTVLVQLSKTDTTIFMHLVEKSRIEADSVVAEGVSRVFGNPIMYAYPIKAVAPSGAYVIDVSELFTTKVKMFDFMPEPSPGALRRMNAQLNRGATYVSDVKSFADNFSVKTVMSYNISISGLGQSTVEDLYTAEVTRSFLLLPEQKMQPRISDSRVGIFNNTKTRYSAALDKVETYSVAHRWNVAPADTAAFLRGELTEPVKPIVFYVDDAFPELWREPIKQGVESWNMAFEKIGFKNVMQARPFPTPAQDSCFDPDNLKYSCIRYQPSATQNAYGPSWCDPQTGEILNASVIVFSNIAELINNWRFVQTAQVDPRVRAKKMPDDVLKESLRYVIAHEIGHTLGFMHNMSASASVPVDSLRSASYTKQFGTTPCIMDYARFNYVAQPGDKGVSLTPPALGVYDYFLVKWNYTFFPQFRSAREEQPTLESWVDANSNNPMYRYGRQQVSAIYDPSALTEDLGDDPIKASSYGVKNLKYILAHLEEWISDDNDYSHTRTLYTQIANQYLRYIYNVSRNIGGIYLNEVKRGTLTTLPQTKRHEPVSKAYQKRAMDWLLAEFRSLTWIDNASLREQLPLSLKLSNVLADRVASTFRSQLANVVLSASYSSNPYTVEEMSADIYAATWRPLLKGGKLTDGDKILQKAMVAMFCEPLQERGSGITVSRLYAPSVDEIIVYNLDPTGLAARYPEQLRDYEAKHGAGSVAEALLPATPADSRFGTPGAGYQSTVVTRLIDNSGDFMQTLAIRSRDLLRSRLAATSGADRAHYQALLIKLNAALKDKL